MSNQEVQGKVKKPFYKKVWFWVIVVLVVAIGTSVGGDDDTATAKKTGTVEPTQEDTKQEETKAETDEATQQTETESVDNTFVVGDVVETEDLRITFLSASEHTEEYITPKDGCVYYRMEFEFENIGDTDQAISSMMDWTCYADGYAANQSWVGDDTLDASISPGKKAKGSVYFEIPVDATEVTVEYETNFWTENKIIFVVK